jgi:hypothetical protein
MPEPAIIFPDRLYSQEWRVEWIDDDGGIEKPCYPRLSDISHYLFMSPRVSARASSALRGRHSSVARLAQ